MQHYTELQGKHERALRQLGEYEQALEELGVHLEE